MFRLTIALIGIMLLFGCTSKEEKALIKSYTENITFHKHLQKTEKIQLYEDNVTKVMLTATYLYDKTNVNEDKRDEVFVVGLHREEDVSDEWGYRLLLNGIKTKKVEKLSEDDPRLKELPFISEWGEYYLVTFPYAASKKLTLVFESEQYGKGELHFAKVAKYIFNKQIL